MKNTDYDWREDSEHVFESICDHCGEEEVLVRYLEDPYVAEVYVEEYRDEHVDKSYWCYDCWNDRKDDV